MHKRLYTAIELWMNTQQSNDKIHSSKNNHLDSLDLLLVVLKCLEGLGAGSCDTH